MAGMRLSLPSRHLTTSMALTFYIPTLHQEARLFLRATVPSDARGPLHASPHATGMLGSMMRTQRHGGRRKGGRRNAAARNARGSTLAHACGKASRQVFPSFGGRETGRGLEPVSGAEPEERSEGRRSVPAWRQIARARQGCRRCHSRVQGAETARRLSHRIVGSHAPAHWPARHSPLQYCVCAASAPAPIDARPQRGPQKATARRRAASTPAPAAQAGDSMATKSHQRSAAPPDNSRSVRPAQCRPQTITVAVEASPHPSFARLGCNLTTDVEARKQGA